MKGQNDIVTTMRVFLCYLTAATEAAMSGSEEGPAVIDDDLVADVNVGDDVDGDLGGTVGGDELAIGLLRKALMWPMWHQCCRQGQ